jgi:hypothetical protein
VEKCRLVARWQPFELAAASLSAKLGELVTNYDMRRSSASKKEIPDFSRDKNESSAMLRLDRAVLEKPGSDVGRNLAAKAFSANR